MQGFVRDSKDEVASAVTKPMSGIAVSEDVEVRTVNDDAEKLSSKAVASIRARLEAHLSSEGLAESRVESVRPLKVGTVEGKIELASACVDLSEETGEKAVVLELPGELCFLLRRDEKNWALSALPVVDSFGLKESGVPIAVTDIDEDENEELLVRWLYSGGVNYELFEASSTGFERIAGIGEGT